MRFLLVDDDRAGAGLLVEALQAASDVHIEVARTADAALARLRQAPRPQIVLLDLNMPGEGGLDVLRRIRGDPALAGVPVIVLTTSAAPADIQAAYALHANAFVTKPADLYATMDAMERLCGFWCDLAVLP